jgi:hypothetical protein
MVPDSRAKLMICSPRPMNLTALSIIPFSHCRPIGSFAQIANNVPIFRQWCPLEFSPHTAFLDGEHLDLAKMTGDDKAGFVTIIIHCLNWLVEGKYTSMRNFPKRSLNWTVSLRKSSK